MDNKCFLCDKVRSARKLKAIDDQDLNICAKINEIFNIQLNDVDHSTKLFICEHCIGNLTISYDFFKCVRDAKQRLISSESNNVMIKVEVKQEALDTFDHDTFSFITPFDYGSDDYDDGNESAMKDTVGEKAGQKKKNKSKVKEEREKPLRKYRRLLPEERKFNRGIRRAKESPKINPSDLYQGELAGNFTDQPEHMQILAEDMLPDGRVSNRITQLFEPTTWSSFTWTCEHCPDQQTFKDILQLNEHLHKAHRVKYKRRCDECQRTTHHFAAYINHIIDKHSSHNKFCCLLCPQAQIRWNLKSLFLHYQTKHRKQKVCFCIYCGLHFIGGAKLKEHLINKHKRSTDEEGLFECDICGWTTDMRHKMKQHMVKHTSQATFMCDQCTVTFATSSYLSTHIKQVHSRIEINCTKCHKLFKSERRLRVHDRAVHQDNKQFLCHICHKAFHAQYRLNSHIRIHTDAVEEKHQCPHCERRFKYKPGMIYHIRAAHTGETPYSCPIEGCNERFFDYSNARKHISGAHNSPLKPLKDKK